MLIQWKNKLDIFGPLKQAERCLEKWLRQEKRTLTANQKQRAAALMARYFHYEDEVTDQLILSFLDHYAGKNTLDTDDPTSIKMEIKAVLDQSRTYEPESVVQRFLTAVMAVLMLTVAGTGGWEIANKKITKQQQVELKSLVRQITVLDQEASPAAVWSGIKTPLRVRSYQDISWWHYRQSHAALQKRLEDLQKIQLVTISARV